MSREFRHRAFFSFVLNIGLVVTAAVLAWNRAHSAPDAPPAEAGPATRTPAPKEPQLPRYTDAASAPDRRRWLAEQLRTMGVPNKVVARAVQADLYAGWNRHAAEVAKKCYGDPEIMAALQLEIDLGRDAEMRAALGEQGFRLWDQEKMLRGINPGRMQLSAAEIDATYVLWKRLQQRELELRKAKLNAEIDEAGAADEYGEAMARFDRQMKALLGNERYAQLRQTGPDVAEANLRQHLSGANPSDAQLQELLRTQRQWNDLRKELDQEFQDRSSSADYAELREELDEARDHEYRRVLGDEAFDRLQKEQHPSYVMMKKHAAIWGLDDREIESVYGSIKYYEKTVQDYRAQTHALESQGENVDPEEMDSDLRQFTEQTLQILEDYLGEESFVRMQRNGVFPFGRNELPDGGAPLRPEDRLGGG